jgi:hypothetical protein
MYPCTLSFASPCHRVRPFARLSGRPSKIWPSIIALSPNRGGPARISILRLVHVAQWQPFTRNYGEEAHETCMGLGIAPKLYACQDLAGGWKAVVIAYEGNDFTMLSECKFSAQDKEAVKEATLEVAQKIHDKGFVHGDLRDSNILCHKTDSELKILFIDWDWAGKANTIKYPATINTDIDRDPNAKPGSPILKEHDKYMLDTMF